MKVRSVILCKVINRQTTRQTERKTDRRRVKHYLLGEGKNTVP